LESISYLVQDFSDCAVCYMTSWIQTFIPTRKSKAVCEQELVRLHHLHKVGTEGGGGGAAQLAGQHGFSPTGGTRQVLLPRKAGQGLHPNIGHRHFL
jgi:hypothetical protein